MVNFKKILSLFLIVFGFYTTSNGAEEEVGFIPKSEVTLHSYINKKDKTKYFLLIKIGKLQMGTLVDTEEDTYGDIYAVKKFESLQKFPKVLSVDELKTLPLIVKKKINKNEIFIPKLYNEDSEIWFLTLTCGISESAAMKKRSKYANFANIDSNRIDGSGYNLQNYQINSAQFQHYEVETNKMKALYDEQISQ